MVKVPLKGLRWAINTVALLSGLFPLSCYATEFAPIPSGNPIASSSKLPFKDDAVTPIDVPPAIRPGQRIFPNIPQGNLQYLTGFIQNYNRRLPAEVAVMIAESILGISKNFGVDFRLVTGVLAVESAFRSDAISSSGAIGLGQLKPATANWLGVSNPFDPLENIAGSAKYIRFLMDRYNGDLDAAISAYFQGQGFVDRNGITEPCRAYLTKVNNVISKM